MSSLRRSTRWASHRDRRPSPGSVRTRFVVTCCMLPRVIWYAELYLWEGALHEYRVVADRQVPSPPSRRRAGESRGHRHRCAALGATALEVGRRVSANGAKAALPSADLARGVLARMTTPLLPDDYLHLINPLWTAREIRGRLVKVVPETDDAATLVIKPGWGWSFDYLPGQYMGIIKFHRRLVAASRVTLFASPLPPAWVAGTLMLGLSKILENMEIGHNVMHGQWDWMNDPEIHSGTWEWDTTCPAEGWKHSHNYVRNLWSYMIIFCGHFPDGAEVLRGAARARERRRVVPPPAARFGQLRGQPAAPHPLRQPGLPDRAPPLPGPAEQPLPRDRQTGAGSVREVRPALQALQSAASTGSKPNSSTTAMTVALASSSSPATGGAHRPGLSGGVPRVRRYSTWIPLNALVTGLLAASSGGLQVRNRAGPSGRSRTRMPVARHATPSEPFVPAVIPARTVCAARQHQRFAVALTPIQSVHASVAPTGLSIGPPTGLSPGAASGSATGATHPPRRIVALRSTLCRCARARCICPTP